MTRSLNSDPLKNFRFIVTINHPALPSLMRLGFMAVTGLSVQNEIIPYREGGNNTTTRKMPGQSDFGPISFTRGMMAQPVGSASADGTDSIYKWFTQIFSVVAGGGFGGANVDFRVTVNIDVLAHPVTFGPGSAGTSITPPIKARFQVFYAWPMSLSYSDLEAGGNAVIIENLTLAHEGWLLLTAANNDLRTFVSSSAGVGTVVSTA